MREFGLGDSVALSWSNIQGGQVMFDNEVMDSYYQPMRLRIILFLGRLL
jgi:hypothetical protein